MNLEARLASFKRRDNRETLLHLYNRLSDEQKASPEGMEILNYINPVSTLSIGDNLPSYEYVDKNGKTVRLDDFRGRWILLDFWSRGCGPCIKAVPELGAVSKENQDKLSVVSISLDRESSWKEASANHGIFWNDWNDPKGYAGSVRIFGTRGIPTFVLITPDGTIQEIIVGYGEGGLRNAVQRALNPVS